MKKIILLLPLLLASCSNIGPQKTKSLVELTPRLEAEISSIFDFDNGIVDESISSYKSYVIAKHNIISAPLFSDGVFYVVDISGSVSAFSNKEKKIVWSVDASQNKRDDHIGGGIVKRGDRLYITNGSRYLIILNAVDGTEVSRKEFPDIIRIKPVFIDENTVLIQTVTNQLLAYNLDSAALVWQNEGTAEILSNSKYIESIVHNDLVIAFYNCGGISALTKDKGEKRWSIDLAAAANNEINTPGFETIGLSCKPIVIADELYVASANGKLLKINIDSGAIVWENNIKDVQSMSLSNNELLLTTSAKQLAIIDPSIGKIQSVHDLGLKANKTKAVAYLTPFVSHNDATIYINIAASNGELIKLKNEGDDQFILQIAKAMKNATYLGFTCCGKLYLVSGKTISIYDAK